MISQTQRVHINGLWTTLSELVSMSVSIVLMPPGTGLVGSPWPIRKVCITLDATKRAVQCVSVP